jgi:hypothetical protein
MTYLNEAKKNTLTAIVWEMSQFELRMTLLMILNGADPDYAIDTAFNPRMREEL